MNGLKQKYRDMPFFNKIMLWMLVVSIIPVSILGIFSFTRFFDFTSDIYVASVKNDMRTADNEVLAGTAGARYEIIDLSRNPELCAALAAKDDNPYFGTQYKVEKLLFENNITLLFQSVFIVNEDGQVFTNSVNRALRSQIEERMPEYEAQLVGRTYFWGKPIVTESARLIPYVRRVISPESGEQLGIIIANYNEDRLATATKENLLQGDSKTQDVLVVNGNTVISAWDKSMIGRDAEEILGARRGGDDFTRDIDGDEKICVRYANSRLANWQYYALASRAEMYGGGFGILALTLILLLCCIGFVFIASTLISKMVTKPLKYLADSMTKMGETDLDVTLREPKGKDEIGQLWGSFIRMTDLLKRSREDTYTAWEENKHLNYQALMAQINPHFIYNTLYSVIWLIENQFLNEAKEMIVSLSVLLHISISRSREFVTVKEEVESVRHFMDIQRVRFGHAFRYIIDVDAEMLNLPTMKIILQPVVENALEHGISHRGDEGGIIKLTGRKTGDLLVFEVRDNGGGLTDERMAEVNAILMTRGGDGEHVGIGIKNVNDRIRYHFKDERLGVMLYKEAGYTVTCVTTKVVEK